ncbi:ABC transporter permease [Bombilactobacillus folatiphilus]|uniref:ABC transporter permease n=1 Tax=Bombilactobacillus folatiphilus TaxID=2923362 RepID=A0ABY4PAJ2_9LACO|nr:ABC transporter permease [Bombilactobacillus folatiphilus]UQS82661.1 ABC transporter permease [Bombilactobacillus folatiphilus]
MNIYKVTWKLIYKNLGILFLGTVVTLFMMIFIAQDFINSKSSLDEPKIAILGCKKSITARNLAQYLTQQTKIQSLKKQANAVDDALYYRQIDGVIYLPSDLQQQLQAGHQIKLNTKYATNQAASLVDGMVDQYFNTLTAFKQANPQFSWSQILAKTQAKLRQKVQVRYDQAYVQQIKQEKASAIYSSLAYGIALVILDLFGTVRLKFNQTAIYRRNFTSPQPLKKINAQINQALLSYLILISLVFLFVSMLFSQGYWNQQTLLFWLNTGIFIFTTIALASLLTSIAQHPYSITVFENTYVLGSCFLGGVFVNNSVLPQITTQIATFTPTYWFVQANDVVASQVQLSESLLQKDGILLLFGLVFFVLQKLYEHLQNHQMVTN